MTEKYEPVFIYALLGIAVGAMAVFILMSQMNKSTVTELTRDASGHIISIYEKKI